MKKVRKALGSVRNFTRGQTDREVTNATISPTSSTSRIASAEDGSYIRFDDQEPSTSYGDPLRMKDPSSTKLHRCAFLGDISKIKKFLLKNDVNCEDSDRRTPLHLSAYGGHVEAVCFLLSSGANVEATDKEGRTPLLRAVERGHIPATQALLQHKANAQAKDLNDTTALHLAARTASSDLLDLLLSLGLDYELPDVRGQTPLHVASAMLDMDIVKVLLAYRANANAADKEGVTPLMIAAKQGCNPLVDLLLQAGALIQHVDCSGWSALSYAKYSGHMELHTYLESLLKKEVPSRHPLKNSGMLGLGFKDEDDVNNGSETSAVEDNGKVDDSNSWNDDSSESNEIASKPTISLSRFMSISNCSLKSSVSSNSPRSLLSNAVMVPPTKPHRSPRTSTPNENETDPKDELSDTIEVPLERVKNRDVSTKEDLVDDPNSGMLSKLKDNDHSSDDVSFNDNSNDDFLPSEFDSLVPGLSQFPSTIKLEVNSSKTSNAREKSNSEASGGNQSDINELKNSSSEHKKFSPKMEDVQKTKKNISPDSYLDSSEQERETRFERTSSPKLVSTSFHEKLNGKQIVPLNETDIVTDTSNEGTLGRIDTLQMREEMWEANAYFIHKQSSSLGSISVNSSAESDVSRHSGTDLMSDRKKISAEFKENPVDGRHEQETSTIDRTKETEISAEESNLSITKPKMSQVSKNDESVVTNGKSGIPKKSNSEVSVEISEISAAVIEQNPYASIICNTNEKEEGKLLSTDNLNTDNCENVHPNSDIHNNDNSSIERTTGSDLNLSRINKINFENQSAEDLNLDVNEENLTSNLHRKFELTTEFSKSSRFEKSIEVNDNISTNMSTDIQNNIDCSPDCNQNKELKRINSSGSDAKIHGDNFEPIKKSLHPAEELISNPTSLRDVNDEYQHSSILSEKDNNEASSSTINSKFESNLNFGIDSLENHQNRNKVQKILEKLTGELKRERTIKETYEIQIRQYEDSEMLLNEKIAELENSLSQHRTNIAASESKEEKTLMATSRPGDETNLVLVGHMDLDHLDPKFEANLKEDGIITIENNYEIQDEGRIVTTEELQLVSTVPPKKEIGTQSEEKCFSSAETQTSPEINIAKELNVRSVSTTTENLCNLTQVGIQTEEIHLYDSITKKSEKPNLCNLTQVGIQTEEINLYDSITNKSEKPNAEKQKIVNSTTQTPSSFFERFSKDSQTDNESIMNDTEDLPKISRAPSEQDISVTCISSETQTLFFLSDSSSQTDCDDSGVGKDVKELLDRSIQVTQITKDKTAQTNNDTVDSCSQTSGGRGLISLKNAFSQTDSTLELKNTTNLSEQSLGLFKSIVSESNNCLRESLVKYNDKLDQIAIVMKKLSTQNDNADNLDTAKLFMELSQLRETILKMVNEAKNKSSDDDEEHSPSFLLTLESIQAKVSCLEEISKQLQNLNQNFEIILTQASETTTCLHTNSESLNNLKQEVAQNIRDLQPEFISIGTKSDSNLEQFQQYLKIIETNVNSFLKRAVNNQSQLDDLKDTLHAITERWDRQDDLVRDLMSSEKQKQEDYLNEMSSLVEQITRDGDNQLHHNLKISLRNLDGTVGENFEIIQNLMMNLRDDMIRKLNEITLSRSKEIHGHEIGMEVLSSDIKTINVTLSNIREKIEFKEDGLSSKSFFEPEIIEAIRGGNDQALTAIQTQGKCIMKTLETCNSMLKDIIEVGYSSELYTSHLNQRETFENKILLQKEHFTKDIEILERHNTVLEEYLAREKACAKEERVRRKELENELNLTKTENKTLLDETQNLKQTNDNMKQNCQDLITKNLTLQKSEQELRNALSLGVNATNPASMANQTKQPCQDPSVDKDNLTLGNDLKLADTKITTLESENIKTIELMNQEKQEYLQQIGNLKNEINTKEAEITHLKQKYLSELKNSRNHEQNFDESLLKELTTLKENKMIMKKELFSKNKLLNDLKERVEEMEILQRDNEVNLKIKTTKIQNMKSEKWELQKKIQALRKDFEEQMYDEKLSALLRQSNEELEKEVLQNRSLILSLRERIRYLSQEKMQLMKEISIYKEEKLSSDLLQKQKDEAEQSLKRLAKEFEKMKTNVNEEFIPKSKLHSLYQEMENHFGALLTKKLYESQESMIEKLGSLECANGTLKGREEALKTEIKGLLDQIQQLKAKLNFCFHNAHLWKSKYQQLFENRFSTNSFPTNSTFSMEKNHKSLDPTYKAPVRDGNILEDIEAILKRPYENSAFLGSLLDPSSPSYQTNTPLDKAPVLSSLTYSSVDDAPQSEIDLDKKVALDSLEKSFQKYLPAERDDSSVSSKSFAGDINTSKSSKYPQPPMDTLQESIDSYVNFLARSSND